MFPLHSKKTWKNNFFASFVSAAWTGIKMFLPHRTTSTIHYKLFFTNGEKSRPETKIVKLQREPPGQVSCRLAVKETFHSTVLCFSRSKSSPGPYHTFSKSICILLKQFLSLWTTSLSGSQLSVFLCSYQFFKSDISIGLDLLSHIPVLLRVTMLQKIIHKLYILKPFGNAWLPMN